MPRKVHKKCTAKDGSDYRSALRRNADEASLLEILNKVLSDVKKSDKTCADPNADPPFLVAKSPTVYMPGPASSQDQPSKPSRITVAYVGSSGEGYLDTMGYEYLQEDRTQAGRKSPSVVYAAEADREEVVQQEVVEHEIVVGEESGLDFHVIETFNVDEIPRAEEMVEIVESQPEPVAPPPQISETQSQPVPIGISVDTIEDPVLATALQLPADSFTFHLLNYYTPPAADQTRLWADDTVPVDSVGRTDPASYLTTYTTQGEDDSSCSSQNISVPQCDLPPSAFICPECRACFSLLHQFQDHLLTHPDPQDKKFLCQFCGKRFLRADHLNRHTMLHKNVKVFKCRTCGEEFGRASHLDKHRRRFHSHPGTASPLMKGSTLQQESKTSEGCNLHLLAAVASPEGRGNQGNSLGGEIVQGSHVPVAQVEETVIADGYQELEDPLVQPGGDQEQDRPHQCDQCGRRFFRITHLRRHRRIHTGERPFLCHICGRRYARGDYLRAHIQAHRKEKVHKCKVCNEVFLDLMRFSEHCRSHSQEEFDLADAKTERKSNRNPNYPSTTKDFSSMMMGELGEIVSMVTVPTSEEVVIGSDDVNQIVTLGTEMPEQDFGRGSFGNRDHQEVEQHPNEGALRNLFQDASKNVNLQEALLSLGSMSSSQIEALLSVASSIVGLTGGNLASSQQPTQQASYASQLQQTLAFTSNQQQTTSYTPQSQQTTSYTPQSQQTTSYTPQSQQTTSYTPQSQQTTSYTPQSQQTTSYTPQSQQTTSYGSQHQQSTHYTSQHQQTPSHTSQHQQIPPYTSQHQQTPPYTSQHQQTPSHTSQHQQTPPYPLQHQQTPSYNSHQLLQTQAMYQSQNMQVLSDVSRSSCQEQNNIATTFPNYTL